MLDIETVLVIAIVLLAVWGKHIILYTGAFAALIIYGYAYADTNLVPGIALLIVAGYMLYRGVMCIGR